MELSSLSLDSRPDPHPPDRSQYPHLPHCLSPQRPFRMRIALGLDVDRSSSFAAVIGFDPIVGQPRELPISTALAADLNGPIVDAAREAVALAIHRVGARPAAMVIA